MPPGLPVGAKLVRQQLRALYVLGAFASPLIAATRFHAGADSWGHDVAGLAGFVEDARNEVSAARVRIELRVWSPAE